MSKKIMVANILMVFLGIMLNMGVICYDKPIASKVFNVEVCLVSSADQLIELYYNEEEDSNDFTEEKSTSGKYVAGEEQLLIFEVSGGIKNIRLDIQEGVVSITDISCCYNNEKLQISKEQLAEPHFLHDIQYRIEGENIILKAEGETPYIVWDTTGWKISEMMENALDTKFLVLKIIVCIVIDAILLIILRKFKALTQIPKEIIENRGLIFKLAKNDFKTQFAGSYLGIFWAFVQPIVTVLVYWFVFEKGLHAGSMNTKAGITVPFVLWLIAGIVPWFFFQDALNGATNALIQYSYLVKKVVFKISVLPVVKVLSALFVHIFFVVFAIILYSCYGRFPDLYMLQILYYTFCMFIMVLGISYITCAIVGFFRDLTQIIAIILQVGVWMTPIMWNFDALNLSSILRTIFKLNPMFYVVNGYRDAFINKVWFWERPELTLYFWMLNAILFSLGMVVFRKLRVHFADVL